jgi:hypothetical protein
MEMKSGGSKNILGEFNESGVVFGDHVRTGLMGSSAIHWHDCMFGAEENLSENSIFILYTLVCSVFLARRNVTPK